MESWDICFRNLSVGYNGVPVLSDINATLPGGKVSVILGGSGCGKSTLLRHVIGLAKPIKGGILIGGKDLFTLSRNDFRRLRKRMGVLFQDGALLGALTLAQNVVLPLSEHLRLQKKLLREAALRVLRMVGLEEFADYYPNQLSGGMRKRTGLARAIIADPALLLCDEPTSGLDPVTTREIHDILIEQKKKCITFFLTTNNMFEAESICDHVSLLNQGNIIEFGKPADICRKYNHLNRLQIMLKNGANVELENSSKAAISIKEYLEQDMIETIHSTEPTLESVFIELTGRGLNEYGKYDCYI